MVIDLVEGQRVAWPPVTVKLVLTLFVVLLLVRNRRFLSIPRGLWALIGGLSVVSAALSLLWR